MKHKFELTSEEALLLDGRVSPEAQSDIDRIKAAKSIVGIGEAQAFLVAEILAETRKTQRLFFSTRSIKACPVCGKTHGYRKYTRSTRYHRRGEHNLDSPIYLDGYEFADRFVQWKGYCTIGCCYDCLCSIKAPLLAELDRLESAGVKIEVPESFSERPPKWVRVENVVCEVCGWAGHEGQMLKERTLMNDGWYPAKCPECEARNGFGKTRVSRTGTFTMVEKAQEEA